MIQVEFGDVLAQPEGIILHGCNSLGIMGSGIALQIKEQYPEVFLKYVEKYDAQGNNLKLGDIIPVKVGKNKWIVNCITQRGFGRQKNHKYVSYDAIHDCMVELRDRLDLMRFESNTLPILFPAIGAGLGGGDWKVISEIIDGTIPNDYQKILYLPE
jgi:O-acetyl-ADP-ribose deacetylase (regulator of RNase III)